MEADELATYAQMTWKTPSDELEDAVENLLAEVKRLQRYENRQIELWDIITNFDDKANPEDEEIAQMWSESVSLGYMGSVYEYKMMRIESEIPSTGTESND